MDKSKAGYGKIQFFGEQARRDGLQYFWVDTCCIDKSSSAELTEAINSMFRWYRESTKCLGSSISNKQIVHSRLDGSRTYCSDIS
jgi:hypothetical protein